MINGVQKNVLAITCTIKKCTYNKKSICTLGYCKKGLDSIQEKFNRV